MPRANALTDTTIRGVKPSGKPQKLFDGNGLFLFVAPRGAKSWRVKYRFQGREKLLTLGTYSQLSLKEAREACADAKKRLSGGVDLSMEKKVRARSVQTTFEFVAREWHENQMPTWTEGYAKDVMERIDKNVSLLSVRAPSEKSPRQNCWQCCGALKGAEPLTRPIGYAAFVP